LSISLDKNLWFKELGGIFMKSFDIALMPGDGIGQEIMEPSFEIVRQVAQDCGIKLNGTIVEAGADLYRRTGDAFPEENFQRAAKADAIYLAAMGLPDVRYPDGTEIGPQHDLRKRLRLYAGVRPCMTMPGLPSPLKDRRAENLDFVIVRESIEGIFAFPRKSE
jgi:3-isopropylmalate dehydrogenase